MRKIIPLLLALLLVVSSTLPAFAAEGKVEYSGDSGKFIFAPGSEKSPTDLFPEFKDVMPGDTLTQKITVKNNASDKVKVKLYIRSLGAHEDSKDFLSQLNLKVATSQENTMAYMFDAAADQTAQMTDWVYLGLLYSGGEVNLDVTLSVPVELDSKYQDQFGLLDWEFKVEELPVEPTDPTPPPTDDYNYLPWIIVAAVAVVLVLIVLVILRRRKNDEDDEK